MRILFVLFILFFDFDLNARPTTTKYGLRQALHKTKLNTLRKYASHGKDVLKPYKRPHIVLKHDKYKQHD